MEMAWATRLYASSIAIVSGVYAVLLPVATTAGGPMIEGGGLGGLLMLAVGFVVLGHGVVLLTPLAAGLRRVSGPLMILWAVVMLANQALLATMPGWGGESGMDGPMTAGMGWDAGMVAIAALMLASGMIMSRARPPEMGG